MPIEIQKITNTNVRDVRLDKHLENVRSVGPIFEGMPFVRFSNAPMNWTTLSSQVLSHFAPSLPFRYLSQEK